MRKFDWVGIFLCLAYCICGGLLMPSRAPTAAPPASPPVLTFSTAFVVFPADTNAMGSAFGGKLMAEMDRCAGITTRRFLYASPTAKDAVTVAANNVRFVRTAAVKDLLIVTGTVTAAGEKSVTVKVTIERETPGKRELLVEGEFVFVAYDLTTKKAIPHGVKLP